MRIQLIAIFLIIILNEGLAQQTGVRVEIKNRKKLINIPSASGLEKIDGNFYVVGDNSPWLYVLKHNFKIKNRFLIYPPAKKFDIIPKEIKPDFEALAKGNDENEEFILAFGSGSKTPFRDVMVKYDLGDKPVANMFSVKEFYSKIRREADLNDDELNIEGAVLTGGMLFLFDRENNYVFIYKWSQIKKYLNDFKLCPLPEIYKLNLPEINGIEAGFSGAVAAFDGNRIIFTASVEDNDNSYDNGAILGSFVGIFNIVNIKNGLSPVCTLLKNEGKVVKIKVESVIVKKEYNGNSADLILVTDSDNGISEVLQVRMNLLVN